MFSYSDLEEQLGPYYLSSLFLSSPEKFAPSYHHPCQSGSTLWNYQKSAPTVFFMVHQLNLWGPSTPQLVMFVSKTTRIPSYLTEHQYFSREYKLSHKFRGLWCYLVWTFVSLDNSFNEEVINRLQSCKLSRVTNPDLCSAHKNADK